MITITFVVMDFRFNVRRKLNLLPFFFTNVPFIDFIFNKTLVDMVWGGLGCGSVV